MCSSDLLVTADTSEVRTLFNGNRTYAKGAALLHMLRHVLGDTLFFRGLARYAGDTTIRYGAASTADVRRAFEEVSGENLGWFFDEWAYGEGYPHYTYTWSARDTTAGGAAAGAIVTLDIRQTTGTSNPALFRMPVDFAFGGPAGEVTATVMVDQPAQVVSIRLPFVPSTVRLDPDGWILKSAVEQGSVPRAYFLDQNFPNPFNGSTVIRYELPARAAVDLSIYNVYGENVATIAAGEQFIGTHAAVWNAAGFPSGVYFCRLAANGVRAVRKLVLIR